MKSKIFYLLAACIALLTAACERSLTEADDAGEGYVEMAFRATETRTISSSYLRLERCTIRIYAKQTAADGSVSQSLVRKYDPGDCPARIKLLAGDYAIRVQCGKAPALASFDDCLYEGTADCTIQSGKTSKVTVTCRPRSSIVQVVFGHFEEEVLNSGVVPSVTLKLLDTAAPDSLVYRRGGDNTGYFTVPAQGSRLEWTFRARNAKKGEDLVKTAVLDSLIRPATKYTLTFKYSSDLPGYIYVELTDVDTSTDDSNDVFVFSPEPEVLEFTGVKKYQEDQNIEFKLQANGEANLAQAEIHLTGTGTTATRAAASSGKLLWQWKLAEDGANGEKEGVRWVQSDPKNMTVTLTPDFFTDFSGGGNDLYCTVKDTNGADVSSAMTVRKPGLFPLTEYDLWSNSITLRAIMEEDGVVPTFRLRETGSEEVRTLVGAPVGDTGDEYQAVFEPEWTASDNAVVGVKVYRPEFGIFANHSYEVEVVSGDRVVFPGEFATTCDQPIPSYDSSSACFTENNATHDAKNFWGSGNNSFSNTLCTYDAATGAAHLKAADAGMLGITMLAAGNFFSGTFYRPGTTGTVYFGEKYDWKARPKALRLQYWAKIGKVDKTRYKLNGKDPLSSGAQDISVIYVAIVDWSKPHEVSSGMSDPTGMWSPDETNNPGEGQVIGYGIVRLSESTAGTDLVDLEIPIFFYDKVAKPSKNYTLVISCSTSYYGDYMCGCKTNEMKVKDFSWVY